MPYSKNRKVFTKSLIIFSICLFIFIYGSKIRDLKKPISLTPDRVFTHLLSVKKSTKDLSLYLINNMMTGGRQGIKKDRSNIDLSFANIKFELEAVHNEIASLSYYIPQKKIMVDNVRSIRVAMAALGHALAILETLEEFDSTDSVYKNLKVASDNLDKISENQYALQFDHNNPLRGIFQKLKH